MVIVHDVHFIKYNIFNLVYYVFYSEVLRSHLILSVYLDYIIPQLSWIWNQICWLEINFIFMYIWFFLIVFFILHTSGPARFPPQEIIEQLKSLNASLKLGQMLCRSRDPDFLLRIINRQVICHYHSHHHHPFFCSYLRKQLWSSIFNLNVLYFPLVFIVKLW